MPHRKSKLEDIPPSSLSILPFREIHQLLDAVSEGVMLIDNEGIIQYANTSAGILHAGGELPERGLPLADISPNDWIETRKILATGIPQKYVLLRLPKCTALVSRMPIVREGVTIGVITTMHDIGNFDLVIQDFPKYKNLSGEFETTIDQMEDIIALVDNRGIVLMVNMAYEKMASLSRNSIVGRHIEDIQNAPPGVIALFKRMQGTQSHVTQPVTLDDGRNFAGEASPFFDATGKFLCTIICLKKHFRHVPEQASPPKPVETASSRRGLPSWDIQRIGEMSGFVVHSKVMGEVVQQALKVSKTDSCVLILGESGVGKTMLASLIHKNSLRKNQPFVTINCGAIPEHLLESELFGYEKGAFTGANSRGKQGLVETADKGTLFLDEIGELHYSLQAKLLEFLEKKTFIRVGGSKSVSVDVRIVAATNKNLSEEVGKGAFRQDLFYRLNVIPISIPPLRDRPEDVRAMIDRLVQQFNKENKASKSLSPTLAGFLLSYPFEGNVRELVNIMEWLLVMGEKDILNLSDLPVRLQQEYHMLQQHQPKVQDAAPLVLQPLLHGEGVRVEEGVSLKDAVDNFECAYLMEAMRKYESIQKVSEKLDVHFSTLWRKLVKYNLVKNRSEK